MSGLVTNNSDSTRLPKHQNLPVLHRFQHRTRWLLIGYSAITILLWYLISGGHPDLMAYIDKSVEAILIALLLIEGWWTQRRTT